MSPRPVHGSVRRPGGVRARLQWTVALLTVAMPVAGCYTTRPLVGEPLPGSTVVLDLNDRGRVALGPQVGPAVRSIEGVVDAPADTAYQLRVSSVMYLNGQTNRWSGEQLSVPASMVSTTQVHQLSRGRTVAVGIGIAAGIALLFAKTNFLGRSTGEKDPVPPPIPAY